MLRLAMRPSSVLIAALSLSLATACGSSDTVKDKPNNATLDKGAASWSEPGAKPDEPLDASLFDSGANGADASLDAGQDVPRDAAASDGSTDAHTDAAVDGGDGG